MKKIERRIENILKDGKSTTKRRDERKKYREENKHIFAWKNILRNTLKRINTRKNDHTHKLLGYSSIELKQYIENLFTDGMTWANYGEWHIDHIKPISSFNKDENISVVCALENLQPLWATTREINGKIYDGNLNKGKKF